MDELKKKRQQNLEKMHEIVSKVGDNFENALKQRDLNALYERRSILENKIDNKDLNPVTRANAKLQLDDVNNGITILEEQVNLTDEYDIDFDETAARKFLAENNIIDEDTMEMIEQNDALDELEKTLGLPVKENNE